MELRIRATLAGAAFFVGEWLAGVNCFGDSAEWTGGIVGETDIESAVVAPRKSAERREYWSSAAQSHQASAFAASIV